MTSYAPYGTAMTTLGSASFNAGWCFWASAAGVTIDKVTLGASVNATRCLIVDMSNNIIASAAFSGGSAAINFACTQNTSYAVAADNSGSNYTVRRMSGSASHPYSDGNIWVPQAWYNNTRDATLTNKGNNVTTIDYTIASNSFKLNIGDVWKDASYAQVNIGDVWKPVTSVKINIGDAWKAIR